MSDSENRVPGLDTPMTLDDLRDWFYGRRDEDGRRVRVLSMLRFGGQVSESPLDGPGQRFRFRTATKEYSILAREERPGHPSYLGAQAGVIGGGGQDLADGRFTLETWQRILADIVAFEMAH